MKMTMRTPVTEQEGLEVLLEVLLKVLLEMLLEVPQFRWRI